ncbi:MAG: adenine phosphoribosyltransferase [Clostridiales bacterium]|nr:adenine phosphoribosyltransferase [Clostridiales bacterium]
MELSGKIRAIPDFPERGVLFRDITTVLQDPDALKFSIDEVCKELKNFDFDLIIGPESRGFIFGMPAAYNMGKGFIPVRKKGKLPYETISMSYDLEYGSAVIEMHVDAVKKGQRVVIVDDLLATGGTCKAIAELVERAGGIVEAMVFFIELEGLKGRGPLSRYNIVSIVKY